MKGRGLNVLVILAVALVGAVLIYAGFAMKEPEPSDGDVAGAMGRASADIVDGVIGWSLITFGAMALVVVAFSIVGSFIRLPTPTGSQPSEHAAGLPEARARIARSEDRTE